MRNRTDEFEQSLSEGDRKKPMVQGLIRALAGIFKPAKPEGTMIAAKRASGVARPDNRKKRKAQRAARRQNRKK